MKNKIKMRVTAIVLAIPMVFAMMPMMAGTAYADDTIPTADVTYDADHGWEGTLYIDENKTIKLSGVTHENSEAGSKSAIKIGNVDPDESLTKKVTVNLVLDSTNVLSGNPSTVSAGIEVAKGSTVNIYGLQGARLTVTGGQNSAAIGGIGYNGPSSSNPTSGNINIYSGTITAIGGTKGSGIGSGYHSSAADINIHGGDVTALGSGCGAGIGSGYGTTGGDSVGSGVGYYDGGNITISGGKVFAASYHIAPENFDQYDTETLYGEGYENTRAAGIGGGYGASSGDIFIEGDAEVTAIGSSGGAGIGTGRGTSKLANYDAENFNCNVVIGENAKVTAVATSDVQSSQQTLGGAAIGLGRGCTIENNPKGTVIIKDNAEVYAVGSYHAAAIGASNPVSKNTDLKAHLKAITIGDNASVVAISDGYRKAIDTELEGAALAGYVSLNADDAYFEKRSDFFTEDVFPCKVNVINAEEGNKCADFAIQEAGTHNVMLHVPDVHQYQCAIANRQGTAGESIYLSNAREENSAQFFATPDAMEEYDLDDLTARLDQTKDVSTQYGDLKFAIGTKEGVFEYGSTFSADVIEDGSAAADLDETYRNKLGKIIFFNAGVKDILDQNYDSFHGGTPKLYVQLPDGWDASRILALQISPEGDTSFADTQKIEEIDGVRYVSFEVSSFGTFALMVRNSGTPLTKMTAKGSKSLVLSWSKIKDVDGYDIFFAKCTKNDKASKCKLVKTIDGNTIFKWTKSGLKKKTAYKAFVQAWVMLGGEKIYVKTSPTVHAYSTGYTKSCTNPKSVTVNKTKVSLKKGKTYKVKATVNKLKKNKKLIPSGHAPKLRYMSSDNTIATVSSKGTIKGKAAGSCKVFVYATNGVSKAITVTVK